MKTKSKQTKGTRTRKLPAGSAGPLKCGSTNTGSADSFLSHVVPVEVKEEVMDQINYLCRHFSSVEWGGVLFYRTEGKFSTSGFKCVLEHIFPMNTGGGDFVSYDYDGVLVKYMMEHPSLLDCKIGHIHSHNTMPVWFSHVDNGDLLKNTPHHNFYLSVIVNNFGDIIASLCFTATRKENISRVWTFLDEDGKQMTSSLKKEVSQKQEMLSYQCQIIKPASPLDAAFQQRCNELKEKITFSEKAACSLPYTVSCSQAALFDEPWSEQGPANTGSQNITVKAATTVESFLYRLFTGHVYTDGDIKELVERWDISSCQHDLQELSQQVGENVHSFYRACFPNDPQLLIFNPTLEECIQLLEEMGKDVAAELAGILKTVVKSEIYADEFATGH